MANSRNLSGRAKESQEPDISSNQPAPEKSTQMNPIKISFRMPSSEPVTLTKPVTQERPDAGPSVIRISLKRSYEEDGLHSGPVTPSSSRPSKMKPDDNEKETQDSGEESMDECGSPSEQGDMPSVSARWAPRAPRTYYDVFRRLIRQIHKLDRYGFFLEPVNTDDVLDYLDVVKHPMDFGTMKTKVEERKYLSLEEFQQDFDSVITNCKIYNAPGTVYFKEADRLVAYSARFFDKARESIKQIGVDVPDVRPQEEEEERGASVDVDGVEVPFPALSTLLPTDRKNKPPVALYKKGPQGGYVFSSLQRASYSTDGSRIVASGAREMAVVPVSSLPIHAIPLLGEAISAMKAAELYDVKDLLPESVQAGPFSSFAPVHDSSRGSLSVSDAEFVLLTLGDLQGAAYATSLYHFTEDMGDHMRSHVDHILNCVTHGIHDVVTKSENSTQSMLTESSAVDPLVLKTLREELRDIYESMDASTFPLEEAHLFFTLLNESDSLQKQLNRAAHILFELQSLQEARLVMREKNVVAKEQKLTQELKQQLVLLLQMIPPSDIASSSWIQEAMQTILLPIEPSYRGTLVHKPTSVK